MKRSSGVLLHVSSLPNDYGIGSFGKEAYDFVDFLVSTAQSYWQILPLTTTTYGNSPYASYSAFAGNIDFINFDLLIDEGYLTKNDLEGCTFGDSSNKVNYELVEKERRPLLEKAVDQFIASGGLNQSDYQEFWNHNKDWLYPFSRFMTLKEVHGEAPWYEWPAEHQNYNSERINLVLAEKERQQNYHLVTQYWFFKQWHALKKYANKQQLAIIGDIPIYVAYDSVEIWQHPEMFLVDEHNKPIVVSGTPADAFSEDGQYWGNPIYDWEFMETNRYEWWVRRIDESLQLYDYVRLDHFRGFESYWEIPYQAESATEGQWVKGPDKKLFNVLWEELGEMNLIAEDLGYITQEVADLLDYTGYPGMKILQHAFTGYEDSDHMPHHYTPNTVAYVGTHDNETGFGWYQNTANQDQQEQLNRYLNRRFDEHVSDALNRGIAASVSNVAIYTMQDLLRLGNEGRMNIPSTLQDNWEWRMKAGALSTDLRKRLLNWTETYYRMNQS